MLLKIGELAKRTGLTVRTLHHYDAIGLLTPSGRSDSGYRLYNAADVKRLYKVVALASMEVPLARIGTALSGQENELSQIILHQIATADADIARATELRSRLQHLLTQCQGGDSAGVDEYLTILCMMNIYDNYFSPAEMAAMRERQAANIAQVEAAQQEWPVLIGQLRELMRQGASPASAPVQQLVARWQALTTMLTGDDPVIAAKVAAFYEQEPHFLNASGINQDLFTFIRTATLNKKEKQ